MTHITALPEECLLEIFSFLSYNGHKSASLVCETWNNVISNSTKFLSKTRFHMNLSAKSPNIKLSRNYRNVRLDLSGIDPSQLLEDVSEIGELLTEVYVDIRYYENHMTSAVMKSITKFLKTCKNVITLSVTSSQIRSKNQSEATAAEEPLKLRNLRNLYLNNCKWIFPIIRCEKLDSITVDDRFGSTEPLNVIDLIEFLNNLNHLNSLTLFNVNFSSTFVVLQPKFKWNEMTVDGSGGFDYWMRRDLKTERKNWENLSKSANERAVLNFNSFEKDHKLFKLLLTHAKTVEELSIHHREDLDVSIYEQTDPLRAGEYEFYQDLPVMNKVKKLKLSIHIPNSYQIYEDPHSVQILQRCPNIENLQLYYDGKCTHDPEIPEMQKVKFLTVARISDEMESYHLQNLEYLKVTSFDSSSETECSNLRSFAETNWLTLKLVHVKLKDAFFHRFVDDNYIFFLFTKLYSNMSFIENFAITYNISIRFISNTEYTEHMSLDEIEKRLDLCGSVLIEPQRENEGNIDSSDKDSPDFELYLHLQNFEKNMYSSNQDSQDSEMCLHSDQELQDSYHDSEDSDQDSDVDYDFEL